MKASEIIKELKKREESLSKEINKKENDLRKIISKKSSALKDLKKLSERISKRKKELDFLVREISRKKLAGQKELSKLEKRKLEDLKKQQEDLAKQREKSLRELETLSSVLSEKEKELERRNAELTKVLEITKLNEKEAIEKLNKVLPELKKFQELGLLLPNKNILSSEEPTGDIHNLPYSERLKHLYKMHETEHIKIPRRTLCHTEEELRKAIKHYSKEPGSEGAMLKLADFKYELDRAIRNTMKFKNELMLDVVVVDVYEVKKAGDSAKKKSTYNYLCAIKDEKGRLVPVGRTYNTNIKAKKGDIITVAFVDISEYIDPETKRHYFNFWAPHVIMRRDDKAEPDTVETAHRQVIQTTGRIEEKKWPKRYSQIGIKAMQKDLEIEILGSLGEGTKPTFNNRKYNGILLHYKGKKFMFDCGDRSFLRTNPDYIFITHSHIDSVQGLEKGTHKPVFLTKETLRNIQDYPMEDIKEIKHGKKYKIGNVTITPFPITHSIKHPMTGFLIKIGKYKFVYATDLIWFKNWKKILNNADIWFADGSTPEEDFIRKKNGEVWGHASMQKQLNWAKETGVKTTLFMNLGPWIHEKNPHQYLFGTKSSIAFDNEKIFLKNSYFVAVPVRRKTGRKKPPASYPKDREDYLDPENWKYPISTKYYASKAKEYLSKTRNKQKYSLVERRYMILKLNEALRKFKLKEFSKEGRFVFQAHWRGASVHGDMRFEMNDYLLGWTMAIAEEFVFRDMILKHLKLIKEKRKYILKWDDEIFYEIEKKTSKVLKSPSDSLKSKVFAFYKTLSGIDEGWKIDLKTGEEKERPAPKGKEKIREKIWVHTKAKQPKAWLDVEGVTPPREIEKSPGGTRFYPGVFTILDKGTYELGTQKPYYKEFFLNGKNIKGRIVFRIVPGLKEVKQKLSWLYWKPDDQTPYVLGQRAIKENWLPSGYSALPKEWEDKLPEDLHFWKKEGEKEQLKTRAEAVNYLIEKGILKDRKKIKIEGKDFRKDTFILTKRYWKGQTVVRDMPVEDWHIKIGKYQFHLDKNPLWSENMAAVRFQDESGFFEPGKKEPRTKYNPNKKIPAFVEILDQGDCLVIEEKSDTIRVFFKGKELKGNWVFMRTTPKEEIWSFKKSKTPKEMNISFSVKEFGSFKKIKTSKDIKFPYKLKGVAFAEGTWHGTFYPWKTILDAYKKLIGAKIVLDHKETEVLDTVGEVTNVIPNHEKKLLEFEGVLYDTSKGRDAAILCENNQIDSVSVRIVEDIEYDANGKEYARKILEWPHLALVVAPEVSLAKIKTS